MFKIIIIFPAGFIGYAPEIYKLVWDHKVEDTDDDQLYYTQLYLDKELRVSFCKCDDRFASC